MAKKILKHGKGYKPDPMVMKCPTCGCKFTFEDEDVKHLYAVGDLVGVGVHCPECNTLCSSLYNDLEEFYEDYEEDHKDAE